MIEALETGGAESALTIQDVYELATRGRVTEVDAALARFSAASRLRDVNAIALRALRTIAAGDMSGGLALLRRAIAHSEGPSKQYLVELILPYLTATARVSDLEPYLELADDSVDRLVPAFDAARAIVAARRGDDRESAAFAERALMEARLLDDRIIQARVLQRVALAAFYRGHFQESQERAVEAARAYEEAGSDRHAVHSYSLLYSIAHDWIGDPDLSRLYAERMTMCAERAGDVPTHMVGLVAQLEIAAQAGDHRRLGSIRARLFANPRSAQYRERFTSIISEALLNGWAGRFETARAMLEAALKVEGRTPAESSVAEGLLAVIDAARFDGTPAKRRAHRLLSQTAYQPDPEPLHDARARRVARILAACACIIAGESARGRRALSKTFDPDQVFAKLTPATPLDETAAPPMLRGYARFIETARASAARHAPQCDLTQAEIQILLLLPEGKSLEAIARSTGRSRNTVAGHVKGIYDKLNVSSRTQAIERARELGIYA